MTGLSVGCVHPNVGLGVINHTPGDPIFPSKRAMSSFVIHSTKLCVQINFCFKRYLVPLPDADFIGCVQLS